jgi:hypothetical protein
MKKTIVIILILGIVGAAFGFYFYNKPRAGVDGLTAEYTTDAASLFAEYNADENSANAKYLGKPIEVTGKVKSFGTDDRGTMNIMIDAGNEMGSVNCQFEKRDQMPAPVEGKEVMIKGFCSGLLIDVVMVDCQMITNKN